MAFGGSITPIFSTTAASGNLTPQERARIALGKAMVKQPPVDDLAAADATYGNPTGTDAFIVKLDNDPNGGVAINFGTGFIYTGATTSSNIFNHIKVLTAGESWTEAADITAPRMFVSLEADLTDAVQVEVEGSDGAVETIAGGSTHPLRSDAEDPHVVRITAVSGTVVVQWTEK